MEVGLKNYLLLSGKDSSSLLHTMRVDDCLRNPNLSALLEQDVAALDPFHPTGILLKHYQHHVDHLKHQTMFQEVNSTELFLPFAKQLTKFTNLIEAEFGAFEYSSDLQGRQYKILQGERLRIPEALSRVCERHQNIIMERLSIACVCVSE